MATTKTVQTDETAPTIEPSLTKWEAFDKANLQITNLVCDSPNAPYNAGCHTNLVPRAENVLTHINAEHGGGFIASVRVSDGKPWQGWQRLKALGVEMLALRCAHCGHDIPLNPQHILRHLKPHPGLLRRSSPNDKLSFYLSTNKPTPTEDEAYSDF
jgi:hypothetical protein